VSAFSLLLRLAVSMAVVMALMFAAAKLLARRGGKPAGRGPKRSASIDVLSRRSLTKGASVATVRIDGRVLVLGVTDHQISLIAESQIVDEPLVAEEGRMPTSLGANAPVPAWTLLLDTLRERTVRRS
jgi:flagellar biogenesis protein FliO